MRSSLVAAALLLLPTTALADIVEVSPGDDLGAAMNALQPGDELVMHGGTYELTGRLGVTILGTADAPIVIRAADGEVPHVHRAGEDQNIIDIDDGQFVTFRGIEFSGGSAGIRISGATQLTIEECNVHDTGDVAVRANDGGVMYEGLRILRNEIHHTNATGEGMYLGCNSNGCQVFDSLIEGNYVHHTNQATVEQGDGIELKEGSYNVVIRDNVIHDTNYPCILTYSTVGNGDPNVIERNVMWNCGDHAIQSAADAVIRNNIILGSNSDGIAMQSHQSGAPSNLVVVHNTVLHPSNAAISLRDNTGMVVIANNALYAQSGDALFGNNVNSAMVVVAGNVGQGGVNGVDGTIAAGDLAADFGGGNFTGAPPIDLFPTAGGALVGAGDPAHAAADDFNCLDRPDAAPDAGAYGFDAAGNPGWTIQEGFKSCAEGADGGSTDDGGSTGGDDGPTSGADESDGGGSLTAGMTDDGPEGGATLDGGGTVADDTSGSAGAGDEDGDGSGCGCTSGTSARAWPWALVVLVVGRGRIRRAARSTAARGG